MKWSTKKYYDNRKKIFELKLLWHKKFAWLPVTDGNRNWYWLEFVDKKYILSDTSYWYGHYEYRGRLK
jgi:hypothetical protein